MNPQDHYREAERLVVAVGNTLDDTDPSGTEERWHITTALATAQIHATLAAAPAPSCCPCGTCGAIREDPRHGLGRR